MSDDVSVPVRSASVSTEPPAVMPAWQQPTIVWPEAATVTLQLSAAAAQTQSASSLGVESGQGTVGGMPVSVTAVDSATVGDVLSESILSDLASTADVPSAVSVSTVPHDLADAAHAAVGVRVARADGGAGSAIVDLGLGYGSFGQAFGGDYGSRLKAFLAPACALTTPDLPECATRTALTTTNDPATQTVTAQVEIPATDTTGAATSAQSAETVDAGQVVLLSAGASSDKGTFDKTSLSSAMSWQAGTSSGAFSTSYAMDVPPVPGGLQPTVALSYSSSAVDGRTNAESAQSSWVGEGWSYNPGYIERTYRACQQDTDTTQTYTTPGSSQDLCWYAENESLVWNGHSTQVFQVAGGAWRMQDDDGSKIEKITSPGNYGKLNEAWRITTPDGTQYTFGLNKRWTGAPETYSAWNVPVFSNKVNEPCYKASSTFNASYCVMTYRWNLDYVVDPNGNTMTYFYTKETPKVGLVGSATNLISYDRGGYVDRIEYGSHQTTAGSADTPPLAKVTFDLAERCLASCWTGPGPSPVQANFPDTPFDLDCPQTATSCSNNLSPSFWTYRRLSAVNTSISTSIGSDAPMYTPVDTWTMTHVFPATGEAATDPALWLQDIEHTGFQGGTALSLPKVHFGGSPWGNRAGFEAANTGVNIPRYRLTDVTNEFGGRTVATYEASDCGSGTSTPDPDNNTRRCFPQQYTTPDNSSSGWTWWNKLRVASVTESNPGSVGGPDITHNYDYWVSGASTAVLWRHDDNRFGARLTDRSWSDFRGWPVVITSVGTGTNVINKHKLTYFRGLQGDRTDSGWNTRSATVTNSHGSTWTDYDWRAGFLLQDILIDGAGAAEQITDNQPFDWSNGSRTVSGMQPDTQTSHVQESNISQTWQRVTSSGTATWRVRRTDTGWDQTYDRVLLVVDHGLVNASDSASYWGTDGTEADETCTQNTYTNMGAQWMTDRIAETLVTKNTPVNSLCPMGTNEVDLLKRIRNNYDSQPTGYLSGTLPAPGQLTSRATQAGWNEATCPGSGCTDKWLTTSTVYDAHGRPIQVTDPRGKITTTVYDPLTYGLPRTMKVINAYSQDTTTTLDLRRGMPTKIVDANGKATTAEFDPLGRTTKVWNANRPTTAMPDVEYLYTVSNTGQSYTKTSTMGPDGSTPIVSYDFIDKLGRPIQSQTPVQTQTTLGRTVSDTVYDGYGQVVKTSSYMNSSPPAATVVTTADSNIASQRRYTYDEYGRQITDELWSNNAKVFNNTFTSYYGDRTSVDTATGGTDTTTLTDVFGHPTELWQYTTGTTPTGTHDTTKYAYDRAGNLTKVTGPDNTQWTYTYDLLGQKLTSVDPDAGTTTTVYDEDGNVVQTTDGNNQVLSYTYDNLNRKTAEYIGSDTSDATKKRAKWVYDTVAKGQLSSAARLPGGDPGTNYTYNVTAMDNAYRPLTVVMGISGAEGTALGSKSYTTNYTYKANGALATATSPTVGGADIGGLGTETLTYGYNSVGQATSLTGWQTYIGDTAYDYDGQISQQLYGDSGKQVRRSYGYDPATRRQTSSKIETEDLIPTSHFVEKTYDAYTYDQAGNVLTATGSDNTVLNHAECYSYDNLRRLTDAWTQTTASCTTKHATGTDPYRLHWDFDAAGNRTQEISSADNGTQLYKNVYHYGITGHAHALTAVDYYAGTSSTITSIQNYDYYANGATKTRPAPGGSTQTLTWTEDGRLQRAHPTSSTDTDYIYDADGNRLIRHEPGGYTTLYLPDGTELRANTTTGDVSATRYYAGIATRTLNVDTSNHPTGGDTKTWTITDPHGTGTIAIDFTTLTCNRRRSLPYGSPNGNPPTGFGSKGFVGGIIDPTGLTHLNAREYDPTIGRFISVDPIFAPGDPQSFNGYAYAANSPIVSSDPSGLRPKEPTDGGSCDSDCQAGRDAYYGVCGTTNNRCHGKRVVVGTDDNGTSYAGGYILPKGGPSSEALAAAIDAVCDDYPAICPMDSAYDSGDCLFAAATGCNAEQLQATLDTLLLVCARITCSQEFRQAVWADHMRLLGADPKMAGGSLTELMPFGGAMSGLRGGGGVRPLKTGSCDSFDPQTLVLMADGSTRPIKDVQIGDKVIATDPTTGTTRAETVTELHDNQDQDLADVTAIASDTGQSFLIHTTWNHLFWSESAKAWIRAADLTPGTELRSIPTGLLRTQRLVVVTVRAWVGSHQMLNLTISQFHTYYVLAGMTPVLVHNDGGAPASSRVPDMTGMTQTQADEVLSRSGFSLTSISDGGYATYKAPDGSKVTIRLEDGRVTRSSKVDPGPNQRNWTQRYGPDGQITLSHDTGENLAC